MHNVHCVAVGQKRADMPMVVSKKQKRLCSLLAWRGKWYNEDKYKVAGGGAGASGSGR